MSDWVDDIRSARSYLSTAGKWLDSEVITKSIDPSERVLLRARLARLTTDVNEAAMQGRNFYALPDVHELVDMIAVRMDK